MIIIIRGIKNALFWIVHGILGIIIIAGIPRDPEEAEDTTLQNTEQVVTRKL